ncbi:MAG: hypothetical protein GY716_16120 [bacterium]|nr:hypothetical protein [bacterium]
MSNDLDPSRWTHRPEITRAVVEALYGLPGCALETLRAAAATDWDPLLLAWLVVGITPAATDERQARRAVLVAAGLKER